VGLEAGEQRACVHVDRRPQGAHLAGRRDTRRRGRGGLRGGETDRGEARHETADERAPEAHQRPQVGVRYSPLPVLIWF
jgi:hypothetical protein